MQGEGIRSFEALILTIFSLISRARVRDASFLCGYDAARGRVGRDIKRGINTIINHFSNMLARAKTKQDFSF